MQSYIQLQELYKYCKKAVNTKLTAELLRKKEKLKQTLKSEVENYLQKEYSQIDDADFHKIVKNSRFWSAEIQRIINNKLEIIELHTKVHKTSHAHSLSGIAKTTVTYEHIPKTTQHNQSPGNKTKMTTETTTSFDVRTATAVIQQYDGASDGLQAFVDSANLIKELTVPGQQPMLLKFLKTRVTGKARIGLPENINSFDEFIKNIKERCQDTTSPDQILAKLKSIKQKENLDSFCEQVETLTDKLKNIYLQQKIPAEVANKMVKKAAVDALISGVSNTETRTILKAGSFDNVKEAIQKVQENGTINQNHAILNFSTRGHHRQGGNKTTGFRQHNRQNFNNFRGNNNRFRGNGNRHGGNFRGNFQRNFPNQNNNYPRPRFNNNRNNTGRMFNMNANPMQASEIGNQMVTPMQNTMHPGGTILPPMQVPNFNRQNFPFLGQTPQTQAQNQFSQ